MGIRVGIDTGGTFTDLVAVDDDGRSFLAKVPSDPADPVATVAAALREATIEPGEIESVVVGTTIGINAVLTRRGARVLYLTTKGFEDIPYIQRINRKHHYDFHWRKPTPLVRRRDCLGVTERLDEEGNVLVPVDLEALDEALDQVDLDGDGVAVAVCLLFSYLNPEHELRVREAIDAASPGAPGLALARGRADLARVRARHDRDRRRVHEAALRRLRGRRLAARSRRPERAARWSLLEVERRPRARVRGAVAPGAPAPVRASRAAASAGPTSRAARASTAGARARHGRNELRRLPDPRRRAALLVRLRARVRLPGQRAERLDEDDRRRRRLDRLGRPRRLPPGRPAERGRRPGTRLLRPGRRGGDDHRRQPRARPARPRVLPRRTACRSTRRSPRAAFGRLGEHGSSADAIETASAMVRVCNENMANAIRILTVEQGTDPREHSR